MPVSCVVFERCVLGDVFWSLTCALCGFQLQVQMISWFRVLVHIVGVT